MAWNSKVETHTTSTTELPPPPTAAKSARGPLASIRHAGRSIKSGARAAYDKVVLQLVFRERPLPMSSNGRHIPLKCAGDNKPLIDERRGHGFIDNSIRTSRYTAYDFFPKQLLFQFSRVGNFYFLCVGIPQMIPGLSTTGNFTTLLPLFFFVFVTMAKEGYDDFKRHRLDTIENADAAMLLKDGQKAVPHQIERKVGRSRWIPFWYRTERDPAREIPEEHEGLRWVSSRWSSISVGDVIRLERDDPVPADIILLHADGENGLAYIETMALDGETNLKSKQVSSALPDCSTIDRLAACQAEFVTEDPNPDLYKFDGRVTVGGETLPLTLNDVIYRGSILRNTPKAIGLVVNTGEECKIRMNANQHPEAKRPALETVANRIVVSLAFYVVTLSIGVSMGYIIWQRQTEAHSWYLEGAKVPFHEIIIAYIIQFNNVIPLSLYVSLEIVKVGQLLLLNSDIGMYDEDSDTPARCNTNTILENLGQVGYIFSDKTGTLTENIMKFRKLSIAGTSWLHEMDLPGDGLDEPTGLPPAPVHITLSPAEARPEARMSLHDPDPEATPRSLDLASFGRRSSSQWRSTGRPDHVQPEVTTTDLLEFIRARPHAPFSRKAKQYVLLMALCHTCLPEMRNGRLEYQASSPDELALVEAARELGYSVVQRTPQYITIRITLESGRQEDQRFEILDVIEFSSKRKRMSIVLRYPDGRVAILCKGADSVIIPRLKLSSIAMQRANEVQRTADLEHEALRQSLHEPRASFGARQSLTIKRGPAPSLEIAPVRRLSTNRSRSFEVGKVMSPESKPRLSLATRNVSMDTKSGFLASPLHPHQPHDRFSFLDDPALHDESAVFSRCFKHLDDFANEGLRTLVFAQRFVPEADYKAWKKIYQAATTSLVDRQELIEAAGDMIEQSLDLVGASAIEDKLQKGVPETIDKLRRANIKIWMLTGDKRETAINIAHSARICQPGSDLFILDSEKGSLESQLHSLMEDLHGETMHSVVVIDGHTLGVIEASPDLSARFYDIMPLVDSVICCRASPAQKASLVKAVRKRLRESKGVRDRGLTLAIGDGANDLAMISASHVGVGISGREGLQAARVADYSIAQFRFLQRMLLVHGRWNYVRTAKFILATFWKEMFFYMPTALYQRYNGYSGTSLYEFASLTVFNTLFTSLCVICMGIWEQDLRAETLLAVPELYAFGQQDKGLSILKFVRWMILGASQGVLAWFGVWAGYGRYAPMSDSGLFALGDLSFTVGVLWINWKLFIFETHHKTKIVIFCFFLTTIGWWGWNAFLSASYAPAPSIYAVRDGFTSTFGRDPVWWTTLFVVLAVLGALDLGLRLAKRALIGMGLWTWPPVWLGGRREEDGNDVWDVEVWQEMEQDPAVWTRLKAIAEEDLFTHFPRPEDDEER